MKNVFVQRKYFGYRIGIEGKEVNAEMHMV